MSLLGDAERAGLSAIQPQVAAALAQVRDALSLPVPEVERALAALSEARGALEIVRLPALACFLQAMQRALAQRPVGDAGQPAELVMRSAGAMMRLLDHMKQGAPYRPLSLSALYQELCASTGTAGSESDLYFPDLSRADALPAVDVHAPHRAASERRTLFQAGLLKFLNSDASGLAGMRAALAGLRGGAAPLQRAAWAAAEALLDAIQTGALPATSPVRRACVRIERELRDMTTDAAWDPEPLLREMLFQLARAGRGSALADTQIDLYCLAGSTEVLVLEEAPGADRADLLEQARTAAMAAQAACEHWLGGEAAALSKLRAECEKLGTLAPSLADARLSDLIAAIAGLLDGQAAHDAAEQADLIDALILVEAVIGDPSHAASELKAAIAALRERSAARRTGTALGSARTRVLAPLSRQPLQAAVAELVSALRSVEQTIETAFADPHQRAGLTQLDTRFAEIERVLLALGEDGAAREATRCGERVARLAAAPEAGAQEWSEAATAIARMVTRLESVGAEWPQTEDAADQPAPQAPPADTPPATLQRAPASGSADEADELRAIFLEEAVELLTGIEQHLGILQKDASAVTPLSEIRRNFHTLKGSGRIAGQTGLGDGAWQIEKLLNEWLDARRPVTANLVGLLGFAHATFSTWIEALKTGAPEPDGNVLQRAAEAVRTGKAFDQTVAAPVQAPPAAPATVTIGAVTLPMDLYEIFVGEAQRHVAILMREVEALREASIGAPPEGMLRAAHTLGGIAGTARMKPMSELAYALEERLQGILGPVDEAAMAVLRSCVQACASMLQHIQNRRPPVADAMLLQALRALSTADSALKQSGPDAGYSDPAVPGGDAESAPNGGRAPDIETVSAAAPDGYVVLAEESVDRKITVLLHPQTPVVALAATTDMRLPFALTSRDAALTDHAPRYTTLTGQLTTDIVVEQPDPVERRRDEVADDIDEHLLPSFLEEAGELIPQAVAALHRLHADRADADATAALKRALHTLKGSARMAGAMIAGEIAHGIESRLDHLGRALDSASALDEMQQSFDRFTDRVERLRDYHPAPAEPVIDNMRVGDARPAAVPPEPVRPAASERSALRAVLRVRADVVDRLVNQAGEVSVARSRIEDEVRTLRLALSDLNDNVGRLRAQLREIEIQAESQLQSAVSREAEQRFDPLEFDRFTRFQELTRGMAESVNDVATVHQALTKALDGSEAALHSQARIGRELQEGLLAVRMVPFSSLAERLHRTVRQTAKELGRRASLEITGGQIEMDRSVLERMTGPLEHLLRNAITHGIEAPGARAEAGKSALGQLGIELRQDGNEVHIRVTDDGRGLDLDAIHAAAVRQRLVAPGAHLPHEQIAELIFLPGFSTAREVTLSAGRGVGMDVVHSEVSALGGRIDLQHELGRGTSFTIHLPLTLGVKRALLVHADGRVYGLPVQMIEQVMTFKADVLAALHQRRIAEWQGARYAFHHLPELLGLRAVSLAEIRSAPVLLVRSGTARAAVQVDRILGIQELVTKQLSGQLEQLGGLDGAAVLGTGEVVLLINPVELAERSARAARSGAAPTAAAAFQRRLVMVVDDSLTVRKVTSRLLERAGYEVVTARDGVDALALLASRPPDIMLVDIEMPRMDGFELTRHVRSSAVGAAIPIVIISSRDADKHRAFAFELGVNAFLGKPYQDEELLRSVARFIERTSSARAA